MAYYRCLNCDVMTGIQESHQRCPDGREPVWEHCTCGSGGHPRRCDLHPGAYEEHIAEMETEARMDWADEVENHEARAKSLAIAGLHEEAAEAAAEAGWCAMFGGYGTTP